MGFDPRPRVRAPRSRAQVLTGQFVNDDHEDRPLKLLQSTAQLESSLARQIKCARAVGADQRPELRCVASWVWDRDYLRQSEINFLKTDVWRNFDKSPTITKAGNYGFRRKPTSIDMILLVGGWVARGGVWGVLSWGYTPESNALSWGTPRVTL